ncbi:MAG: cytochrome c biogenesis protein CcsA [bacterium]
MNANRYFSGLIVVIILICAYGVYFNANAKPQEIQLEAHIQPAGMALAPPYEGTLGVKLKHDDPQASYAYSWDLNGDGEPESTEPTVNVKMDEVGSQKVTLSVIEEGKVSTRTAGDAVMMLGMNAQQVQEHNGYTGAVIGLLLATILFFAYFLSDNLLVGKLSKWAYIAGYAALIYSLGFRAISQGVDQARLPNIHLYEVLQFFSFFALGWSWWASARFKDARPMAYCSMLVGLILLYISNFSVDLKDPGIVQPALQSYWRNIHVTAIILSYGGIAAAYFASLAYLMKPSRLLDHIAYKTTLFAYPLLTAGIMMGGLWANEAWGTYWSWDPKETSSLVIWLVLTAYLHTRMILGWSGVPSALLSIAGFASMVFCFVGLNFMPGNSLHKYAGIGMGVSTWAGLSAFLLFHAYIWISQRPWAEKKEADMIAKEIGDVSESGVDPVEATTLPTLSLPGRAAPGAIRIPVGSKEKEHSAE